MLGHYIRYLNRALHVWDIHVCGHSNATQNDDIHFYIHHNHFTALFPGPPRWAGARRELLDFTVQWKINRGRHTYPPAGRHSIWTKQCQPPPSLRFLQARCPFCHLTNSVPDMTYNVFSGTLNPTQSINQSNQCPPPPSSPFFFTGPMPFLPPNQQCQSTAL